jgi:tetratricopeptide (TPR) repeat protein
VLRATCRWTEEDAVDGMTEYPLIRSDELVHKAWAAMGRQATDEALRLWASLREHAPDRPEGHVWPIKALWESGRFDEAEAMAANAFAKFPDHPDLLVHYAWIATRQERWEEAAKRWAAVRSRLPDRIEGYVWGARALWQYGRPDRAEALAAEALRRFPDDIDSLVESAWTATARQDWEEAARRWMRVYERDPDRLDGQVRLIQALRMVGRHDEAEETASASLARHPDETDLLVEHVWVAVGRQDWQAAAARLQKVRDKPHDYQRLQQTLSSIEHRIRTLAAAEGPDGARPARLPVPPAVETADDVEDDISPKALVLSFENIGERCDFGAVQRHFGVEPLGLLRFAYSPLDSLVTALENRFDVIGSVEDTGFELYGDETILRMKKYELIFHTFNYQIAQESAEKRDAFFQQQRRRLLFLKNKLIVDLEEQEKIFVYSTAKYTFDEHAARLSAALRTYGPNSLLYVRPASPDHPDGTVEVLGAGLYAGYFPGMTNFAEGAQPPFEIWRQLCARTYRLAKAGSPDNGFQRSLS